MKNEIFAGKFDLPETLDRGPPHYGSGPSAWIETGLDCTCAAYWRCIAPHVARRHTIPPCAELPGNGLSKIIPELDLTEERTAPDDRYDEVPCRDEVPGDAESPLVIG